MKSYPIWNIVSTDAYHTQKNYGARAHTSTEVRVGTSASNSHTLVEHRVVRDNPEEIQRDTVRVTRFRFQIRGIVEPDSWYTVARRYMIEDKGKELRWTESYKFLRTS